jgi:hypothetical protein
MIEGRFGLPLKLASLRFAVDEFGIAPECGVESSCPKGTKTRPILVWAFLFIGCLAPVTSRFGVQRNLAKQV